MQRYVSDELTHFVGKKLGTDQKGEEHQYQLLCEILRSGKLGEFDGYGMGVGYSTPLSDNDTYDPRATCFCDIPLADFFIHMKKYSRFGLAFRKSFATDNGAMPVFYIPLNSLIRKELDGKSAKETFDDLHFNYHKIKEALMHASPAALESISPDLNRNNLNRLFGNLASFVFSYCKFFDGNLNEADENNFYMEREWRLHGSLKFQLGDVSRVIFPKKFAKRFREDLPDYIGQITFS